MLGAWGYDKWTFCSLSGSWTCNMLNTDFCCLPFTSGKDCQLFHNFGGIVTQQSPKRKPCRQEFIALRWMLGFALKYLVADCPGSEYIVG